MQSYAKFFKDIAASRVAAIQAVGRLTLERLFPDGSPEISPGQRTLVMDKLLHEMRPALMMETLLSARDEVTGTAATSARVKDAIAKQPTVGGGYSPGQPVRSSDKTRVLEM